MSSGDPLAATATIGVAAASSVSSYFTPLVVSLSIVSFLLLVALAITAANYLDKKIGLFKDLSTIIASAKLITTSHYYSLTNQTFADVFERRVDASPHKTFMIFENVEWTYADVEYLANRIARWLHKCGVGRGDVVALMMHNCPQYVAIWLAVMKVGAATALLNTTLKGKQLAHCVQVASPKVVFTTTSYKPTLLDIYPQLRNSNKAETSTSTSPISVPPLVTLDDAAPATTHSLAEELARLMRGDTDALPFSDAEPKPLTGSHSITNSPSHSHSHSHSSQSESSQAESNEQDNEISQNSSISHSPSLSSLSSLSPLSSLSQGAQEAFRGVQLEHHAESGAVVASLDDILSLDVAKAAGRVLEALDQESVQVVTDSLLVGNTHNNTPNNRPNITHNADKRTKEAYRTLVDRLTSLTREYGSSLSKHPLLIPEALHHSLSLSPLHALSSSSSPSLSLSLFLAVSAVSSYSGARLPSSVRAGSHFNDVGLLIYTSGTTGLPKAASLKHCRVYGSGYIFKHRYAFRPDDRILTPLPLYHSAGGVVSVVLTILNGSSIVVLRRFSASRFWAECVSSRATCIQYIGELCRYLVASPPSPHDTAHCVRLAFGNGLRGDVWKQFMDRFHVREIGEFYASTEGNAGLFHHYRACSCIKASWAAGQSTSFNCKHARAIGAVGHMGSLVKLLSGMDLLEFDSTTEEIKRDSNGRGRSCHSEEVGEMVAKIVPWDPVRTYSGYYGNKDGSLSKVLRSVHRNGDVFFRTGDLLRFNSRGYWFFVDRVGDTFRWKGENVSTRDVEEVVTGVVNDSAYRVPLTDSTSTVSGESSESNMSTVSGESRVSGEVAGEVGFEVAEVCVYGAEVPQTEGRACMLCLTLAPPSPPGSDTQQPSQQPSQSSPSQSSLSQQGTGQTAQETENSRTEPTTTNVSPLSPSQTRSVPAIITPSHSSLLNSQLNKWLEGFRKELPGYSVPLFIRLNSDLTTTGTFKHVKSELKRVGADPELCPDTVYMLGSVLGKEGYIRLTDEEWRSLSMGAAKL